MMLHTVVVVHGCELHVPCLFKCLYLRKGPFDSKKSGSGSIPTDILIAMKELTCLYLIDWINSTIYDCKFPDEMKITELSPIYKHDDPNFRGNHRHISVLPSVSEVCERVLNDQISQFFHEML